MAGIFGATRAPFSFKKLAKQAARDMEDQTLVINGVNTAPALYTILIAADDDPMLAPFYPELSREVREFVKAQAEKRRYVFVGEPLVRFMIDPQLRAGKVLGLCRERRRPHARSSVRGRACLPEWPGQNNSAASRAGQRSPRRQAAIRSSAATAPRRHAPAADAPCRRSRPARRGRSLCAQRPDPPPRPSPCRRPSLVTPSPVWAEPPRPGAAVGLGAAAGIASNMASTRAPQRPLAQLVDVVSGESHSITSAQVTIVASVLFRTSPCATPTCRAATPSSPLPVRTGRSRTSIPPTARSSTTAASRAARCATAIC